MKTPLLRIERTTHHTGLFGSGQVISEWLACTTPDRALGASPDAWLGYRRGATPAEALAGLDVPSGMAELLDHARIYGLAPIHCAVNGSQWMAGYLAPWFGCKDGQVLWVYADTPDGAVQAARAALEQAD